MNIHNSLRCSSTKSRLYIVQVLVIMMQSYSTTPRLIERLLFGVALYWILLYGSVSQGLGTTKFTNLIGWNGYWPRSRFSHLFIVVGAKKLMRKKKRKEDEKTLEELNSAHHRSQAKCQVLQTSYIKRIKLFLFSPYNKHLSNRTKSVCMGESWPRSCVQTSLRSVCTYDLCQDSPIQTSCSVNKS